MLELTLQLLALCSYNKFAGFHGILAGLVVAVKQVMPEHEAKLFGFVKLTFKVGAVDTMKRYLS